MSIYKMYELTACLNDIESMFDKEEIDQQEYDDTKESLDLILKDESQSLIKYMSNIKSTKAMIDKEIEKLKNMSKAIDNKEKFIMESVHEYMSKNNLKEVDGVIGKFKIKKNPAALKILDLEKIPDKYIRLEQKYIPDKNAIKRDLKLGKEVDGVEMISGESISLK